MIVRIEQKNNSCIGVIQENLIENSIRTNLPYIQILNGPCELFLAYPKPPYVRLKINMYNTHCIMLFF